MSDKQTIVTAQEGIDSLKEEEKAKLAAAEQAYARKQGSSTRSDGSAHLDSTRRQRRSPAKSNLAWLPGVILVGLGVIFLLNNFTGIQLYNWWALFILIPAAGSFSKAAEAIRTSGEFTRSAWSAMAWGAILSLVAAAFLFNLDWGLIWPAFLIIGGLGIFLGAWKSW